MTKKTKSSKKSANKKAKNTKSKSKTKLSAKSAKAKTKKRKKPAPPMSAKFAPTPLTERAKKVAVFLKKGPATLQEIADAVFKRERPAAKRNSWVRNQMRVLRGNKLVTHTPRKGDKPAMYSLRKGAELSKVATA